MNYENYTCPVCKAKLFDDDDIVVCPVCGAPHHRECYNAEGHCHYESTHGTPEQWQPIAERNETPPDEKRYCKYCGAQLPDSGNVCMVCGRDQQLDQSGEQPLYGQPLFGGQPPYDQGYQNPYAAQFAAVDQNEVIAEGVTAGDVLNFTGPSCFRYLGVYKRQLRKNSKLGWNWMAFLFPELWLFTRKIYAAAISIVATRVIFTTMLNIIIEPYITSSSNYYEAVSRLVASGGWVISVIAFCSLLLRLFFGLFGDYIYRETSFKRIRKLKSENKLSRMDMQAAGSVNIFYGLFAYFAEYALMQIILVALRAIGII